MYLFRRGEETGFEHFQPFWPLLARFRPSCAFRSFSTILLILSAAPRTSQKAILPRSDPNPMNLSRLVTSCPSCCVLCRLVPTCSDLKRSCRTCSNLETIWSNIFFKMAGRLKTRPPGKENCCSGLLTFTVLFSLRFPLRFFDVALLSRVGLASSCRSC